MEIYLLMAIGGLVVVTLAYTVARSNVFLKAVGLIGLIAGEIMMVVGSIGYMGIKEGLPAGLALGTLMAGGQSIAQRQLGIRGHNKPTVIKWAYRLVAIAMGIGLVCCAVLP